MRDPETRSIADDGVWDLDELEDKTMKPTQWGSVGPKSYKGFSATHAKLPAGAYNVTLDHNDNRIIFIRRDIKTDAIMRFKESWADKILSEIDRFWKQGRAFQASGFLHRRGYLLYGPQGTGKSSLVQQIIADIITRDGVVLICENPKFFNMALTTLRQAEAGRNIVCIFEDIDAIIKKWGEDELLSILDGANMIDRVLNIATTNYPESLDKRIVSRPRRFDRVIKIVQPSDEVRAEYLKKKLPRGANLKKWVEKTKGLSFAGMTEALISVQCLGNDFDETIRILTDLENGHPSSDDFGKKTGIGFGADDKKEDDDD